MENVQDEGKLIKNMTKLIVNFDKYSDEYVYTNDVIDILLHQ